MTKRLCPSRNYNAEPYWDTVQIETTLFTGTPTGSITIPANSFVQTVLVQIVKKPITTGAVTIKVGDASDDDGFLVEQQATEATKTIFGNDKDEVGDYLLLYETSSEETKTKPEYQHIGK